MKSRVLIVEDEKDVRELMALHVRREGHDADEAKNGNEALEKIKAKTYDLLVLDWMLPGLSGLDICKAVRSSSDKAHVPVLMVTARVETADIVLGLEMGADDYLTKPFQIPVFLARIHALLRRSKAFADGVGKEASDTIQVDKLRIDADSHRVFFEDREIELTLSEFNLLLALMKNRGRVLSRQKLLDLVQGEGVEVIDRTIDTHVFGLRKKLGEAAAIIETIRGIGYRIGN